MGSGITILSRWCSEDFAPRGLRLGGLPRGDILIDTSSFVH
jgi:hypothetical protein